MCAAPDESTWSAIAPWYDDLLARGSGPHETALESLLGLAGDLDGSAVLDVACGQGLATHALGSAGAASVTAVDCGVYLNSLLAAGLRVDSTDEPRASRPLVRQQPFYEQVPIFFSARAIATGL